MDRNYQRERGIKSSGQAYYRFLAVNSLEPCVKACSLHIEDIFTPCFQVVPALRNKRRLADLPVRNNVCKFSIKFNDVDTVTAGDIARKCVGSSSVRIKSFEIDIGIDDSLIIIIVYAGFSLFQSKTSKAKGISGLVILVALALLYWKYTRVNGSIDLSAPIFQQFNPFYVVALTPVSMAIFGSLAAKGKEPSAPRKIAYGMLVAAVAFLMMIVASQGLLTPNEQKALADAGQTGPLASANWLIGTYLVLTFAELLLSPMGISFVSKVAPPKYKGMMMGGWFVATAIGNFLVAVGGLLWGDFPLWIVWAVFLVLCILSALFMFVMMKRLEKVAK